MSVHVTPPDIGIDYLLARCVESDGCLLWKLKMRDHQPVCTIGSTQYKVRRLLWAKTHANAVRGSYVVMTSCDNEHCVHPDHLVQKKRNFQLVGIKRPISHRRRSAEAQRARGFMTPEAAAEVRSSTGPLRLMAEKHGISIAWASRIRKGEVWRDYSSPFAALIGAA